MLPADHDFSLVNELNILLIACWVLLGLAPVIFFSLVCAAASPYGRHVLKNEKEPSEKEEQVDSVAPLNSTSEEVSATAANNSGRMLLITKKTLPARTAWVLQESPAFYVAFLCFYLSGKRGNITSSATNVLLWLFLVHYIQRSFIYPLFIRGGKPFPVSTFLMAFQFCVMNGYLQGRYLALTKPYPDSWFRDPRFVIGVLIFLIGMGINLHSDHVLRNLRKPGETGYKIPHGGMFRWLSAPNLFGEVVEWSGFAIANWSWPTFTFAVLTAANLVPRAIQHHAWYRKRFGDEYPAERRAFIPGVF